MHERTVRHICRVSFLAVCVAPTLGVAYWIIGCVLPGSHQASLDQLAARLGVELQVASFATPQPGLDRYQGVSIDDIESGESLAIITQLEVFRRAGRTTLVAEQIDCRHDRLDQLWQVLAQRLQTPQAQSARLVVKSLEVKTPAGPLALRNIDIDLRATPETSLATILFHTASDAAAQPLRLKVSRNRASQPATVQWQLETGEAEVPCVLVEALLPQTTRLGGASKLRGQAWGRVTGDDWYGALSGVLTGVDMQSLLAAPFPYPGSGTATLQVERAEFQNGGLLAATASVAVGPGSIDAGLIAAAIDGLGVVPIREMPAQGPIEFEQLAFVFRVDQHGLVLRGGCANSAPGDLLVDRTGPLLSEPRVPVIPTANLVHVFLPHAHSPAPATAEAAAIARMLPLPAAEHRR